MGISIERLPSKNYRAIVTLNGQRMTATRPTRGDALFAGSELYLSMGGERGHDEATVGELLAGQIAAKAAVWSPGTTEDRKRILSKLPDVFLQRRATKVNALVLGALWRELAATGWTQHRVKKAHVTISSAFSDAVALGVMRSNPCALVSPPTPSKPDLHIPTLDIVRQFLAAPNHDDLFALFVRVAATLGARRGEVIALQWDDVDVDRCEIRIRRSLVWTKAGGLEERPTKTGIKGQRVLTIDLPLAMMLRRRLADMRKLTHDRIHVPPVWIFSDDGGQHPWTPNVPTGRWATIRSHLAALAPTPDEADAVRQVRLHDLRHYLATSMLQDGEAPIDVAAQLGHASLAMVLTTYAHLMGGRNREAIDRIASRFG